MNRFLLASLISLSLTACSKKRSEPPIPTEISDEFVDSEGITKNAASNTFEITQYNTLIDTTVAASDMTVSWALLTNSSDSVSVTWSAPQGVIIQNRFDKRYDHTRQKWVSEHKAVLTAKAGVYKITATLRNNTTGKTYVRSQDITINRKEETFDIFRVKFGMTKAEVKSNEMPRLGLADVTGSWTETNPDLATASQSKFSSWYGATQYGFKDGKLVKVKDINNEGFVYKEHISIIRSLIKKYGNDGAPQLTPDGESIEGIEKAPVIWKVAGLKVTFEKGSIPEYPTVKQSYWMAVEKDN